MYQNYFLMPVSTMILTENGFNIHIDSVGSLRDKYIADLFLTYYAFSLLTLLCRKDWRPMNTYLQIECNTSLILKFYFT